MTFAIRSYHPTDLTMLYRICLLTGANGEDATAVYNDPDLLGHYYAGPYAVLEPALCFILTHNDVPCGYVLGTKDSAVFAARCEAEWFPLLRARYPLPDEADHSADANIIRLLHRGHNADEDLTDYPAHLHIDLLPMAQGGGRGRQMLTRFFEALREQGARGVHLGVGRSNERAVGFYEHMGMTRLEEHPWGFVMGLVL
ncbi:MAG: GNAT family N-acetyltransferase [Anaerolineales bacterium]|nr:GNAT family N-acetyltransferase [Anaerolineales bacterium]